VPFFVGLLLRQGESNPKPGAVASLAYTGEKFGLTLRKGEVVGGIAKLERLCEAMAINSDPNLRYWPPIQAVSSAR